MQNTRWKKDQRKDAIAIKIWCQFNADVYMCDEAGGCGDAAASVSMAGYVQGGGGGSFRRWPKWRFMDVVEEKEEKKEEWLWCDSPLKLINYCCIFFCVQNH